VIVCDLDLIGIPGSPYEANAPLIIDPNAVLACSVACQLLQSITWWDAQLPQLFGRVENEKLSLSAVADGCGQPRRSLASEYPLGVTVGEALDHAP